MITAVRNAYDHRLKQAIVETGDPDLFPELAIPESTRRTWIRRGVADVISFDRADADVIALRATVGKLEKRVAILTAVVRLLVTLVRVCGISLGRARVAKSANKTKILNAVAKAESVIGRLAALKIVGLTKGRLRQWKHKQSLCMLDDAPPCPKTKPGRLTRDELAAMRDMVESDDLKHFSLRSLSLYGKRLGKVLASYGTWCRLVRSHGWRRPRRRLYPAKPKVGLRATRPNEWFHVDVTIIKLLDGTRCYLHGVIDGFSRRVLAWTLQPTLSAEGTRQILVEALACATSEKIKVLTDGGSENMTIHTDDELSEVAEHVIAQVDIAQSNSLIERLWYQLRHRWLYLHQLDSFSGLEKLIATYFLDHNTRIPTMVLGGRTPDEAYFGREADLPQRLRERHIEAQRQRVVTNRGASCSACTLVETGNHASATSPPGPVR